MTCKCEDYRICKRCFGSKAPESINLGSTVGAALSEGIIQSVLRTHHFGGAFIATEDKHLLDIMRRSEFKAPDTIIGRAQAFQYHFTTTHRRTERLIRSRQIYWLNGKPERTSTPDSCVGINCYRGTGRLDHAPQWHGRDERKISAEPESRSPGLPAPPDSHLCLWQ